MKIVAAIGVLLAASQLAPAQMTIPTPSARSASGQFVIHDRRGAVKPATPTVRGGNGEANHFELEPAFLAVSCERIKRALYFELDAPQPWQGKVHVTIQRSGVDEDATFVSERFRDGWNYQLSLPQRIERTKFIRTLVQVLLTEMANRSAGEHPAEIPAWLIEGLTQHLLATRESELILTPPVTSIGGLNTRPIMIEKRDQGPLEAARLVLRDRPPITIEELSWPTLDQITAPAGEPYRRSAQLFVAELTRLKHGRSCLRETVTGLGRCYNWQTAFLQAFREHFPNQLALEKWWSLQVVYFVGRDPTQLWTAEESWQKLDQALRTTVAIRSTLAEMPAHGDVSLQAIIREWDRVRQATTIRGKLRDLELAKVRVAPEFILLTEDYRRVLATYLEKQERSGSALANILFLRPSPKQTARDAIRELDELDARRAVLHPRPGTDSRGEPTPVAARTP